MGIAVLCLKVRVNHPFCLRRYVLISCHANYSRIYSRNEKVTKNAQKKGGSYNLIERPFHIKG